MCCIIESTQGNPNTNTRDNHVPTQEGSKENVESLISGGERKEGTNLPTKNEAKLSIEDQNVVAILKSNEQTLVGQQKQHDQVLPEKKESGKTCQLVPQVTEEREKMAASLDVNSLPKDHTTNSSPPGN